MYIKVRIIIILVLQMYHYNKIICHFFKNLYLHIISLQYKLVEYNPWIVPNTRI